MTLEDVFNDLIKVERKLEALSVTADQVFESRFARRTIRKLINHINGKLIVELQVASWRKGSA